MSRRSSYKQTLFDREGPDAAIKMKAWTYALIAGGVSVPMWLLLGVFLGLNPFWYAVMAFGGPPATALFCARLAIRMMDSVQTGVEKILTGGSSTPYTEQYSVQQTMVMQGRLDEALRSYEEMIAAPESTADVRIRAAELYAREAKRYDRAAELLQEVLRMPQITAGEEVYAANRYADLLSNHLNQPGKALVQLRRIADRYAGTPVGDRAREAIKRMKTPAGPDIWAKEPEESEPAQPS